MIDMLRGWRERLARSHPALDEPSPARREIERQSRRHAALRMIAGREIERQQSGNFLADQINGVRRP